MSLLLEQVVTWAEVAFHRLVIAAAAWGAPGWLAVPKALMRALGIGAAGPQMAA